LKKTDYKFLVENQSCLFIETDESWKITFVNPAFKVFTGKDEYEILHKSFFDFMMQTETENTFDLSEDIKSQKTTLAVHTIETGSGLKWTMWNHKAVTDKNGKIFSILSTGKDITELKDLENNLRNRIKYFETILNNLPVGITVNELDGGSINFMNKEFQSIFGYQADEFRNFKNLLNKVYPDPDFRKAFSSRFNSDIRNKKPENLFSSNIEIKNKAGDKKFISVKTIPLYDQNLLISTMQDISEQVQTEKHLQNSLKEKEILLREIHHRVKNNMQTISSLLDLQAESISDSRTIEAFRSSQTRIRSMALIHEKLYKSENLSRIKSNEYIQSLTDYLEGTFVSGTTEITILNEVENLLLTIDIAIPCGMIINELVSNSMKYAFSGKKNGTILITLKIEDNDKIILSVKDNGIGFPEPEARKNSRSLGLQLVELFAQQVKGILSYESDNGTTVKVIFPKPGFIEKFEEN